MSEPMTWSMIKFGFMLLLCCFDGVSMSSLCVSVRRRVCDCVFNVSSYRCVCVA